MPSVLEEKYAAERDKRLFSGAPREFVAVSSPGISDLGEDPWIDYEALNTAAPALKTGDHIKFLIVGAGHCGILHAHRLIDAGFDAEDIRLVDVAGGYGGTWYWNRYPGLTCDVESYIYLPLLEETGYVPTRRYCSGYEIRRNVENIAAKHGLKALFGTRVDSLTWDEADGEWAVKMTQNRGPERGNHDVSIRAQFVIGSYGPFGTPLVPKLPGFDDLRRAKHAFHTSRWDYNYTGGTEFEPSLVNLKDKVVGIVGTGATGIQSIPSVAKWAKHLYVFQRTPSYCGARHNQDTDAETWKKVAREPGWQLERRQNFNHILTDDPLPVDMVNDGWTNHGRGLVGLMGSPKGIVSPEELDSHWSYMFNLDVENANKMRDRIEEIVKDPVTANALKPWFPGWCKRPTFHDDYYLTFNQPNVTLVDTDGKGIEKCTESGVLVGGVEYELDVLILATGYETKSPHTSPSARMGARIIGRGGQDMEQKWGSSQFGTLYGIATHGFPNLFFFGLSGNAATPNMTSILDINAKCAAHIASEACKAAPGSAKAVFEVIKESEEKYTTEVEKRALFFSVIGACTPGYVNAHGTLKATKDLLKYTGWGGGVIEYERMVEEFKAKGNLEGVELRSSGGQQET